MPRSQFHGGSTTRNKIWTTYVWNINHLATFLRAFAMKAIYALEYKFLTTSSNMTQGEGVADQTAQNMTTTETKYLLASLLFDKPPLF